MAQARVAVAAGSRLGAAAAEEVARGGGNAVDACLAAAVMAWVAEPFFASLGGSGFVTVRAPGGRVEVVEGSAMMPSKGPGERGQGIERVYLDYSNGMYTGIGGGSVAVPGVLSAVHSTWKRHGRIEWEALFAPAVRVARAGFEFPRTSAYYLSATWDGIWSRSPAARAQFAPAGALMAEGQRCVQAELAEALAQVAEAGPNVFYEGPLGRQIVDAVAANGGFLEAGDLRTYRAAARAPVTADAFGWRIETNPPPAAGGAALARMVALLEGADLRDPEARLKAIAEAEEAAIGYRNEIYADPGDVVSAPHLTGSRRARGSESTTHSSAADSDGFVCSLTQSNGYGAGLMPQGILLNNTLGEEELNPLGAHRLAPGARCHSNMAPTIASGPDESVALGSPGADRIVGAIVQVFAYIAIDGLALVRAVAAPRAHVSARDGSRVLWYEPGLPGDRLERLGYVARPYEEPHMFFGAVQAASLRSNGSVDACHDPRRSGGSVLVS